jgi:hypothetical protein
MICATLATTQLYAQPWGRTNNQAHPHAKLAACKVVGALYYWEYRTGLANVDFNVLTDWLLTQKLSDDGLAAILAFTLMLGELDPKTLLRVRNSLHCRCGNLELRTAKGADSDGWDSAHPLDHPEITLCHARPFTGRAGGFLLTGSVL